MRRAKQAIWRGQARGRQRQRQAAWKRQATCQRKAAWQRQAVWQGQGAARQQRQRQAAWQRQNEWQRQKKRRKVPEEANTAATLLEDTPCDHPHDKTMLDPTKPFSLDWNTVEEEVVKSRLAAIKQCSLWHDFLKACGVTEQDGQDNFGLGTKEDNVEDLQVWDEFLNGCPADDKPTTAQPQDTAQQDVATRRSASAILRLL